MDSRGWQFIQPMTMAAAMFAAAPSTAGVVLSEFMASNRSGLRDEDGDRSDWIELFNDGSESASLAGMALTDDPDQPARWPLPPVEIAPGARVVVFASGKDRRPPGGPWHASFRLDASGEYLALVRDGIILTEFSPSYPPQAPDVSFGFAGGGTPQPMTQPTPGAPNVFSPPVAPVTFAPASGIFTGTLNVTLASTAPGAAIWYTLDGSTPQPASSFRYEGPLTLTTSTRLKAVAAAAGFTSAATAVSWVQVTPALAAWSGPLPLVLIENFGQGTIPSKGWSSNGAGIKQVPRQEAAWLLHERSGTAASLTGPPQLAGLIGIRGRGAVSTTWVQKPYHVEPRDAAAAPVDVSPLGLAAHDEFVFYYPDPTGGDFRDPTMLFNTFAYDLSRALGRWAPRFRFVEVFLNENGGPMDIADRRGVYALLEKVSRGEARLPFDRLSADGQRGGALLGINRMDPEPETGWPALNGSSTPQFFHTPGPDGILQTPANVQPVRGDDLPQHINAYLNFDQPSGYTITTPQRAAIEAWFTAFEQCLYDDTRWRHPTDGWRSWLVEEDWAGGYMLHNLVRHTDALRLSLYPWLGNDRRLRMGPLWDMNFGGYYVQGAPDQAPWYRREQLWFPRLFADVDFQQQVTDLWSRWRRGALSNAGMEAIIDAQAAEITPARAVSQGVPTAAEWTARLATMKSWLRGRAAYLDAQSPAPPVIAPSGGIVPAGTAFTVATTGPGQAWRAGGDPRQPGGDPHPDASAASSGLVSGDVRITARTRDGAAWSAPTDAVFVTDALPAAPGQLEIAEIHYHPAAPAPGPETAAGWTRQDFEFIEIRNTGAVKVSLLDAELSGAVVFRFSDGALWSLAPGARLVVAANRSALTLRSGPGLPMAGEFSGSLPDAGGTVTLTSPAGLLASATWDDDAPWPEAADGDGYSLTRIGAGAGPSAWRTSAAPGGTPGTTDTVPFPGGGADAWRAYALPGSAPLTLVRDGTGWALELSGPPAHDDARWLPEAAATPAGPWSSPGTWTPAGERRPDPATRVLRWISGAPPPFSRVRAVPAAP